MIGTIRWNIIVATVGLILTVLLSLNHNVLLTSVIRGAYTFAALFMITFFVRWFIHVIFNMKRAEAASQQSDDAQKGVHIDLSTPEEQDEQQQFTPLDPPTYETKEDIEEVVKVIRHMSED